MIRKLFLMLTILGCAISTYAQCARTCKVTFIDPATKKPFGGTATVELVTGYTLWQRTGDGIYNDYGGKTIFAIITRPGKSAYIVTKVKVGKGSELVWCGASPCQVNCILFSNYSVTDLNGTKGTVQALSY